MLKRLGISLVCAWLCSGGVLWADTVTTTPVAVVEGPVALDPVSVPLSGQVVKMCWTPGGADPAWPADGRQFDFMWQESEDGSTWYNMTGAVFRGGPKTNRAGQTVTCFPPSSTTSRFSGTIYIRLMGSYTGAPMTLSVEVTY